MVNFIVRFALAFDVLSELLTGELFDVDKDDTVDVDEVDDVDDNEPIMFDCGSLEIEGGDRPSLRMISSDFSGFFIRGGGCFFFAWLSKLDDESCLASIDVLVFVSLLV